MKDALTKKSELRSTMVRPWTVEALIASAMLTQPVSKQPQVVPTYGTLYLELVTTVGGQGVHQWSDDNGTTWSGLGSLGTQNAPLCRHTVVTERNYSMSQQAPYDPYSRNVYEQNPSTQQVPYYPTDNAFTQYRNELTPRELEVLARIARGRSNHEIAQELLIGEQTVKTHVSNILSKLHLADRTQAAIYALQKRLVPLHEALDQEK